MKLKFIEKRPERIKLTVPANKHGGLYFNVHTVAFLALTEVNSLLLAIDEEGDNKSFYASVSIRGKEGGRKLSQANSTKCLQTNVKSVLDILKLPYKTEKLVFAVSKETINDEYFIKFTLL